VVKDPTQPGPSLVTEVKDSSLTILHQILQSQVVSTTVTGSKRARAQLQGLPAGGRTTLRRLARSRQEEKDSEEKDFWVFIVGPRVPFLALSEEVSLSYYLLGLARVGKKEGAPQIEDPVFWGVSSSLFSLRLCQGVPLGPIYSLAPFSGDLAAYFLEAELLAWSS
jgi:hypothetical protein